MGLKRERNSFRLTYQSKTHYFLEKIDGPWVVRWDGQGFSKHRQSPTSNRGVGKVPLWVRWEVHFDCKAVLSKKGKCNTTLYRRVTEGFFRKGVTNWVCFKIIYLATMCKMGHSRQLKLRGSKGPGISCVNINKCGLSWNGPEGPGKSCPAAA